MVRVLAYIVLVFLLAVGFAWLADRPGAVVFTWQNYEIRASLMVAAVALVALIAALAMVGAVLRGLFNMPGMLGRFFGARRRERGYRALSAGMIAVGAGDVQVARRAAGEATALLGKEPLTLLLTAQAAQLAGDGDRARSDFEALAARPDTRVLGLHGLFIEARRQGEHAAARHFAEEAARQAPRIGWAGTALFEYQAREGDWLGALRTLSANADQRLVDKADARRLRATLLTARAMELEAGDPVEARAAAQEAHRLQPDLAPAAVVAARLLTRADDIRRAVKVLETAWKASPHPEIAEAYATVRPGDSVRDRLKRMRRLAELRPSHPESMAAVARAAIDAREFGAARTALEPLVRSSPSERVSLLMAEIEERENGDQGRVRAWLTRALTAPRDPAWVADGRVFERWAPVSPSGRVGAFQWRIAAEPPPARPPVELAPAPSRPDRAILPAPAQETRSAAGATGRIGDLPPRRDDDRLLSNRPTETLTGGAPAEAETDVEGSSVASANESGTAPARQGNSERVGPNEAAPAPPPREGQSAASPQSRGTPTVGEMDKAAANETPAAGATATKPRSFPTEDLPIPRLVRAPDDPGPSPKAEPKRGRRFWPF